MQSRMNNIVTVLPDVVTAMQALQGAAQTSGLPEKTAHLYAPGVRRVYGEMEWEAMLRQLDREDPSYRN